MVREKKSLFARKRFGQHFLDDEGLIENIVQRVNPQFCDCLIEIGPGRGALTAPFLQRLKHLHVIELDRDLVKVLKDRFKTKGMTVYQGDVLKFNFASFAEPLRIVGNLPYNISTPLLFYMTKFSANIIDMHFMLQKEVVDRMVAEPSCADYGCLSVMLQYHFVMESLLVVPPESFWPPPKVHSAVVRLIPARGRCGVVLEESQLKRVVTQAFSQRRKTLRNNLRSFLSEDDFTKLAIDASLRPENLLVEQFVMIANYILTRKPPFSP